MPNTETFVETKTSIYSTKEPVWIEEFLIALRGQKTQRELSQLMGFSFNQVGKWERGVKSFRWSDLFKMAEALKLDYLPELKKLFWNYQGPFELQRFLKLAIDTVVEGSVISETVSREWKSTLDSNKDPYLLDVFKLLSQNKFIFISFVNSFVDVSKIVSLKDEANEVFSLLEFIANQPKALLVIEALKLEKFKCTSQVELKDIQKYTLSSKEELEKILAKLLINKIIHSVDRSFVLTPLSLSFSFLANQKIRSLTKLITEIAAQKYPLVPMANLGDEYENLNPGVSSVRVNSLSNKATKDIQSLVAEFHQKINYIIQTDSEPKTSVQLMVFHSFDSRVP